MKISQRYGPQACSGAAIHDHFQGSGHCVECGGACRLLGSDRALTEIVRWIYEQWFLWGGSNSWVEKTIREAGYDPDKFKKRAAECGKGVAVALHAGPGVAYGEGPGRLGTMLPKLP